MLLDLRPDLTVVDLRGNVPTRLRKLHESEEFQGILLAEAGLRRLGFLHGGSVCCEEFALAAEVLDAEKFMPAAGQGAVALEVRSSDEETRKLLQAVNDPDTFDAVAAERKFLEYLQAGCDTPVGVLSRLDRDQLVLRAVVYEDNEAEPRVGEVAGPRSDLSGVARRLLESLVRRKS
jgi:hydroxymethylbilane synthase